MIEIIQWYADRAMDALAIDQAIRTTQSGAGR